MTPMLVNADHHFIPSRISITLRSLRGPLSGQVIDRHGTFLCPEDWQPIRGFADRCPDVDDISTEMAVLSKESLKVFQKLVIGMALFNFTRTVKSADSRYEANQFVSLG